MKEMKFLLKEENNLNYAARVIILDNVEKVPNTDNLSFTNVNGLTVIVDNSYKIGDFVVFFIAGSKINSKLLSFLNAFKNKELNDNKDAKTGFFEDNCRVKMIKLKGIYSEGFIISLKSLSDYLNSIIKPISYKHFIDLHKVPFDTIKIDDKEYPICEKYIVELKDKNNSNNRKEKKSKIDQIIEGQFNFHVKIPRIENILTKIVAGKKVHISCKYHGTSAISAHILCKRELTLFEKFLKWCNVPIREIEYKIVSSSRSVIRDVNDRNSKKEFYEFSIWEFVNHQIKHLIAPGMTWFYEIIGYLPSGAMIQKGYDYGCEKPTNDKYVLGVHYKVVVYRMTMTSSNGFILELPMKYIEDIINRCFIPGLITPHCYFEGILPDYPLHEEPYAKYYYQKWANNKEWNMEQLDPSCTSSKVPFEGLVIRFEGENKYDAVKLKTKLFLQKKSDDFNNDEINIEDNQDET